MSRPGWCLNTWLDQFGLVWTTAEGDGSAHPPVKSKVKSDPPSVESESEFEANVRSNLMKKEKQGSQNELMGISKNQNETTNTNFFSNYTEYPIWE